MPDINFLLDNDADGVRNDVDSDDDGDGIADSDDANPYQFDIITAPQSFTTEQDTGVSISLEFNVPEDPASTLFPGYDNHPAHGVLSGEFPHFTYTPNAGFSGVDSFQYKVTCLPCSAVYTGVYTSDTATVTINVTPH